MFVNNYEEFKRLSKKIRFEKVKPLVFFSEKKTSADRENNIRFIQLKSGFTPNLIDKIDEEIFRIINNWYKTVIDPFVKPYRIDFGEIIKFPDFVKVVLEKLSYIILFTALLNRFKNRRMILTLSNYNWLEILKRVSEDKKIPIKIINLKKFDEILLKFLPLNKFVIKWIHKRLYKDFYIRLRIRTLFFRTIKRVVAKISGSGTFIRKISTQFLNLALSFKIFRQYYYHNFSYIKEKKKSTIIENTKKILVISETFFTSRLEPIVEELSKNFVVYLLEKNILDFAGVHFASKYNNIITINLEQYNDAKIRRKTHDFKATLKELFITQRNSGKFNHIFKYDGISYWDLIAEKVEQIYSDSFTEIYKNHQLAEKLLSYIQPKFLLAMNADLPFEKTIISALNTNEIPSYIVQHGLIQTVKPIFPPFTAKKLLVWGELCRNTYIQEGITEDKFEIIGNPRYDGFFHYKNSKIDKKRIYKKLKIHGNKKIILYATTAITDYLTDSLRRNNLTIINELAKIIKEDPALFLIIKGRSSTEITPYKNFIKNLNFKNCLVIDVYDIKELLNIADVVIIESSTVGLEAFLFNKPVISVNFTGIKYRFPLKEYEAGLTVENPNDLKKAIYNMLCNKELKKKLQVGMRNFVKDAVYKFDGKATLRLVNYLKQNVEGD